ncbi:HlyD family efflux transporter periplasmic adaptor subunit [Nocardioides cavernae]|uniref:HlyD family efflux transporter periplasmic adaptor subunit n=1 Tax=Nocardioides cavernae TaxID=1921566 RepID=A0ABR8N6J9_9ACTN|nr:biotin carboxylase N-terminal domain-containing protein [Nocardioides cavernae]MBD3923772.1 HlyD family efflux transporter periplasmic adaptor subunit [Nocardioides cavernae]MBM7511295.1 propionyl-CoA carboxylase alpha chain [Nocardioides cavernae]
MIQRLLVANRGEIARRVFATCRRLGIETVAVHSDADAGMPFVAEADRAVRLPGNTPADTYLRADLVIEAARRSGADAIHPGYGFLSENAAFAQAVIDAGLTWVGPPPEAIEAMGDKVRAKEIAEKAGVPVLTAPEDPTEADLPLLVKASAGGGGRGMRVVRTLDRLEAEIEAARAEAESAFGDGTVFVEPYVEAGRHVEVQLVAAEDPDVGTVVEVFGTRDCSVQRRHQKVVEEAPAPALSPRSRVTMEEAAASLAQRIGYRGAGTVEFLHDPATDRFFFLEMNTRLQVEHPVTELVRDEDLVALQIAVAEGRGLARTVRGDRALAAYDQGHAIEVRLYAEDASYVPQSGRLLTFDLPADGAFDRLASSGIRVDSGFASGDEVSTFYDAMLAKVMAWAPTREQAIRMLVAALRRARIHGVTTNRDQLVEILTDPVFVAGEMTTTWLESRPISAESPGDSPSIDRTALVAGALMLAADDAARRRVQQGVPAAWRNVVSEPQRTTFEGHDPVEWWGTRDGFAVDGATVLEVSPTHARLEVDGVVTETRGHISSVRPGAPREVWVDSPVGSARLREVPRFTDPDDAVASGSLLAPMPGTVVAVKVETGAEVAAGDVVLVLEAMKMQHTVTAPHDGTVTEINVEPGSQVASGEVLAVVATKEVEEPA